MEYHLDTMRSAFRINEANEIGSEPRELVVESENGLIFRGVLAGKSFAIPFSTHEGIDARINEMAVGNCRNLNLEFGEIPAIKACQLMGMAFAANNDGIVFGSEAIDQGVILHIYPKVPVSEGNEFVDRLQTLLSWKGLTLTLGQSL